jgi:uncharacterized damage-inducible protein DinB
MGDAYFTTLARYNQWANRRLYDACAALDDDAYRAPRPAFFGSIHATLNHIMVGDRIWTGRIAGTSPADLRLDQILYDDLPSLAAARGAADAELIALVAGLAPETLDGALSYSNLAGQPFETPLRLVLGHLFNHQTHHRGQVHDQLSQTKVAPPPLDLIYFLRQ